MITDSVRQPDAPSHDTAEIMIRTPSVHDVPAIADIINDWAAKGMMLPRSQHQIYQFLRDFLVAEVEGEVIACGALHVVWEDLAEVRSLAVAEGWLGRGIGRRLVERLLRDAKGLGLPGVFALTYQQQFFERMGFHVVPRESLPHKIWGDCLNCPKFPNCDEIAMVRSLDDNTDDSEE